MRLTLTLGGLACLLSATAFAGPITYSVSIDSSSIAGTSGSFDFNFNPGPFTTQAASLQILGFTTNGSLTGSPSLFGNVSGTLPATLTFNNGAAFNDYFQGLTFGSTLSFSVSLFGPALSAPDGVSTSGSAFAFSMFSDAAGTIPALTTDNTNGFAYVVNVNLDGTTTATSFLPPSGVPSGVPEPGTASLILAGVLIVCCGCRYKGTRNQR
jgi:hypothetical protein